ncbi:uncharacterized protein KQ657_001595 [Scheffersomyces spartinae]|uniref:SCP domain-containing protein n=1 Tax=Scheffersomyces spartinae TaxID=45513 RepID=A0A9P7V6Y0_9ASCO|nr:uncharacterized protein KQ657_001595 [Scheffersomyces spartinae]KAG7192500.1 hypothetical protein KQ657_001595 [Scheffersomyces spartinae]
MKVTSLLALGAISTVAQAKTYYETVTFVSTIFADVTFTTTASPKYVTEGGHHKHAGHFSDADFEFPKDGSDTTIIIDNHNGVAEASPSSAAAEAAASVEATVSVEADSNTKSAPRMSTSLAYSFATTIENDYEATASVKAPAPSSSKDSESTVSAAAPTQASTKDSSTGNSDIYSAISNSPGLNETFAKIILDYHNDVRRIHQAPEMAWNKTLWEYAQKHADAYVCGSGLKHTGGPFGENLLAGGSDPTVAAPSWYSEEKDWVYGVNGTQYSHFSQMVWFDTDQLGCAYKYCSDREKLYPGYYVICNYYKFGNVMKTQAKQVLPPIKSLEYLALTSYN